MMSQPEGCNLHGQVVLLNLPNNDTTFSKPVEPTSTLRRIGAGHCGSVWTYGDASLVLKRADGAQTRYLWKEYYMQTRASEALSRLSASGPDVRIPQCYWYTNPSDTPFWSQYLPHFPTEIRGGFPCVQQASNAMCSERIPPLSTSFRETLIRKYCPEKVKHEILQSAKNEDSIARLYLGRRRTRPRPSMFFSLRNFPLWLDQAEELGVPVLRHAETMACSVATMHWEAEIDAGDVEFVLASPRQVHGASLLSSSTIESLRYNSCTRWQEREIHTYKQSKPSVEPELWLLDFDCCGVMTMDNEGVEQAVAAFFGNDPYYPRPCSAESPDHAVWEAFEQNYLSASGTILERRGLDPTLATRFIKRLIAKQAEPSDQRNVPHGVTGTEHSSHFYQGFISDTQCEKLTAQSVTFFETTV